MSGSETIAAPRDAVWAGLNDPAVLKQCIPGCDSITKDSPTSMTAKASIKLGPVKASFTGKVTLSDLKPPESYRISGQGQGGLAGFASGSAAVRLTAISAEETQLDYDVDAQVGGKIAMLGSRLIDATAQSLSKQFFTKFANAVKAKAAAAPKPAAPAPKKAAAKKPVKKSAPKAPTKKAAKKKK
ncbi:MAG: carbon monoxide dehydrogenase subunit G [Aestuariivirga sp.]